MANLSISGAVVTDMTNQVTVFSVDSATQNLPGSDYTPDYEKWFGYYVNSPDFRSVIDTLASWIVGKGFKADPATKAKLDKIRGNGKDTFNSILFNQVATMIINGDSFAEIIEDDHGRLRNLKPMHPKTTIKSNTKGMITGYQQPVIPGEKLPPEIISPERILHLSWGRIGSECHGRPFAEALEKIIEMKGEAMADLRIVFHRYVKPLIIAEADTQDDTELAALKVKLDKTVTLGENMVVPKGSFTSERISIPQYSTLDPLPWIKYLDEYFTLMSRVPEVIRGSGRTTTEASSRVLYVSFQQVIEWGQLYVEESLKAQVKLEIELEFPVSLDPVVQQSISKQRKLSTPDGTGALNQNGP